MNCCPDSQVFFKLLCRNFLSLVAGLFILTVFLHSSAQGAEDTDICTAIPGADIATAVGGTMLETKSSPGRCVYIVGFKAKYPPGRAFVIYRHEAGDYDGLKDAMEGPRKNLVGIGNEAVITRDKDSGRYWLLTVIHGKAAFQVSGDTEEMTRKVAEVALKNAVPE